LGIFRGQVPKIPQPAPIGELDLSRRRGGYDEPVIDLNRQAMRQMHARVELEIVPGATHLFEEPGTLDRAAELAAGWFARYLRPGGLARAARGSEGVGMVDE
jgi:hypothetical protein